MFKNDIEPAIEHYHRLISGDMNAAEEQLAQLVQLQIERKVTFAGRPLASSLRPAFLSESAYQDVQDTVYLLRQAILNIAERYFNRADVLEELGLEEWELSLAGIPTNVIRLSATARMDAFMTSNSFKFVELNAESPAGLAYVHHLAKIYRELPVFKTFTNHHPVRFVSPLEHLVHGLLRIYHEEFGGEQAKPAVAIVDHLDVPTYNEFLLVKDFLELHGMACEISDPRELECRDGWIYCNGRKIDLLYRRLLINEFQEMRDECGAFFEGYVAQRTCYLNSFRTKLVHKKALFSLLTDQRFTEHLTTQQIQAIRDHIPWTRRLSDKKTSFYGLRIQLADFVSKNRELFVIKPNDEYGGKDVTIGAVATDPAWHAAVTRGIENGYVVQEAVDIRKEPFLIKGGEGWSEVPTIVDLDPYLNGPLMGGCLTRVSTGSLANVTAGGGSLPLFILRYD